MRQCKAKAIQVDLRHIPAYEDILRHNLAYAATIQVY